MKRLSALHGLVPVGALATAAAAAAPLLQLQGQL